MAQSPDPAPADPGLDDDWLAEVAYTAYWAPSGACPWQKVHERRRRAWRRTVAAVCAALPAPPPPTERLAAAERYIRAHEAVEAGVNGWNLHHAQIDELRAAADAWAALDGKPARWPEARSAPPLTDEERAAVVRALSLAASGHESHARDARKYAPGWPDGDLKTTTLVEAEADEQTAALLRAAAAKLRQTSERQEPDIYDDLRCELCGDWRPVALSACPRCGWVETDDDAAAAKLGRAGDVTGDAPVYMAAMAYRDAFDRRERAKQTMTGLHEAFSNHERTREELFAVLAAAPPAGIDRASVMEAVWAFGRATWEAGRKAERENRILPWDDPPQTAAVENIRRLLGLPDDAAGDR